MYLGMDVSNGRVKSRGSNVYKNVGFESYSGEGSTDSKFSGHSYRVFIYAYTPRKDILDTQCISSGTIFVRKPLFMVIVE